jgi:hypothetical protein
MLRQVIRLYDRVERGLATGSERIELRQLSDSYGITPKGQQDRRWAPPKDEAPAATTPADGAPTEEPGGRYAHLRSVPERVTA